MKQVEVEMKNVRLRHALFSGACLLFVIWAYAGPKDFWEAKPYTDWTAKEVDRILRSDKSPWTRTLLPITASSYSIGSNDTGASGGGGGGRGGRGGGGSGGGAAAPTGPTDEVIINWNARPIREAMARDAMLRRPDIAKAQLDTILNYKPESLELLVTGLSLGRRRGAAEADTAKGGAADPEMAKFKEDTFLQKKNQEKIPLLAVITSQGMGLPITLKFARETDGKPTLTPDDKEVMLQIRIGDKKYKYTFKLADMMVGDKLEI
jgi:hypothetical protein